jgi:hypothetical protein
MMRSAEAKRKYNEKIVARLGPMEIGSRSFRYMRLRFAQQASRRD